MSDRSQRSRRTGVASLATLAAVAALSVATPAALTGTAQAAGGHRMPAGSLRPTASAVTSARASVMALPATTPSVAKGTVYVADPYNNRVVAISPDGTESTVEGDFYYPYGVAVDASGNLFVADTGHNRIVEVAADGTQTVVPGTSLGEPTGVAVDASGNLFISDYDNGRVVEVTDGTQTTVMSDTYEPYNVAVDNERDVYTVSVYDNLVHELAADGTRTTFGDGLSFPTGIATDNDSNVYIADNGNGRIVKVTPDGTQTTLPFQDTEAYGRNGVAVDADGNVVSTRYNQTVELATDGSERTLSSDAGGFGAAVVGSLIPTQKIGFTSDAPTGALPGDGYTVSASGGDSGNPVTFSTQSDGVCTVTDNGDGTADVSLDHAGDCVIDADQAGNEDFPAAPEAHQTVTVGTFAQAIDFTSDAPTGALPGDGYTVSASGGDSGNPVTFSTQSDGVCTVTDNGDSTADVSLDHAGDCVIDADQAGNGDNTDAPQAHQTVSVGMFSQAVEFTSGAPKGSLPGDGYVVSATGGDSGNPVTFATQTDGVCSVSDNGDGSADVTLDHAGDCVIDADQEGAADYSAADQAHQTVTVGQFAQQVTFTSAAGTVRTGDDYTATATGGDSGNPVTFAVAPRSAARCTVSPAGEVHFVHARPCWVVASQEGDQDYAGGSAVQIVHVLRAPQVVRFTSTPPRHAKVGSTYHAKATGNRLGRVVRLSVVGSCSIGWNGLVRFTTRGTCSVFAHQVGNADYKPGHAKQVIAVTSAGHGRGVVHLGTPLVG